LACCAVTGLTPDRHLAEHLENCAECRDALNELRNAAVMNSRVAAGLPEPSKSVSLAAAFLNSFEQKKNPSGFRFPKPAFVVSTVAACVAILIAIWASRRTPERSIAAVDAPKIEATWEPTWQRLREEVGTDTLPTGPGGGSVVAHYRVKDAYSELN
jgi:hypothetical protein